MQRRAVSFVRFAVLALRAKEVWQAQARVGGVLVPATMRVVGSCRSATLCSLPLHWE
jgi:hypothetical protein